ncbi:hypothetical protein EYR38_006418 [Pleurotus pulmonarius]|nr:hypothetical protein EYR38_006418 [Pleurotus pulmonarius]
MPILTTTIEDPSPLISYSTWKQGTGNDDLITRYSQSSFTAANTQDASMSFSFNGTAVEIFGARRDNHGDYQITIDNVTSTMSGLSTPNVFKTSLFSISNLTQGFHTITLTNKPTDNKHHFVDVDFITWESRIGRDGDNLVIKTYQDTDPSFLYTPSEAWSTSPGQIGLFNGGSGHEISGRNNGTLIYTFSVSFHELLNMAQLINPQQGDGVQLYGPVGPLGAPYTVQVDGGPVRSLARRKTCPPSRVPELFLKSVIRNRLREYTRHLLHELRVAATRATSSPIIRPTKWWYYCGHRNRGPDDLRMHNGFYYYYTPPFEYASAGGSYYTEDIPEPSLPHATVASSVGETRASLVAPHSTRITRHIKGQPVIMPRGPAQDLPSFPPNDLPGHRGVNGRFKGTAIGLKVTSSPGGLKLTKRLPYGQDAEQAQDTALMESQITWESHIGKDKDSLMVRTVQDTDPSFSFSPSKLWSDNPDQIGLFNGGSGHQITGPTSGDGVQLFGPIGPLGAPYTVQIDGGPVRSLTSARDFYIPQMMLFHADNLGDGNHVLRLEYHGSSTNQTFAIDYANIINASSMKSSRSRAGSASMSRGLSGGLIAAIVILVLLIVACIIAFFLIMRRRWYLPPNDRKLFNEGMPARPPLPPVAPSSYYTGYTSSANRMAYGRGNGQRERLTRGNTISSPSILTFTSFDPSVSLGRHSTTGRSYYTRSEGIPEEPIPEPSVPYATVASSSVGGRNSIATPNRARITQNAKGQTVMGPEAAGAGRELPAPPMEQPRPTESREVDDRQSRFYPSDIAPPDYHQATDPLRESNVQDEKGNRSVINR